MLGLWYDFPMRYSILGIGASIFAALLPFVVFPQLFYSAVNSKYFFIVVAVDLLALVAAYELYKGRHTLHWKKRWLVCALLLVLAVYYLAGYFGVFFEKSLWSDILRSTGVLFLTHIAVLSLLLGEFLRKEDWALLRRLVVISSAIFAIFTIIGIYGLGIAGKFLWIDFGDDGLSIGNSTFAGIYLLLAFLLGAVELVRSWESTKWRRALRTSLTLIALSPIMLNIGILFGRTPIAEVLGNPLAILGSARASSATMLLLLLFLLGRYLINRFVSQQYLRYALPLWSGVLLVCILSAVGLLFVPGSAVQQAYVESSTSARVIVWNAGLQAFAERPIWSWGPENFNDAYEKHFNNALYLEENVGEVWFDRAHNIVVDTLVATGLAGAASAMLFGAVFLWTIYRAYAKDLIGNTEAVLLAAFIPAHFLQLQTGFDTVASYVLVGIITGYALSLEWQAEPSTVQGTYALLARSILAIVLVCAAALSLKFAFYDEQVRQSALVGTFTTTSAEEQKELVRVSLAQSSDWHSLRLSMSSFIKGAIEGAPAASDKNAYAKNVLDTAAVYEEEFQRYFEKHPDYYRARMNYAYLLVTEAAFGGGPQKLVAARDLLKDSYVLSPDNPLTYGLDALVFLYGLNFNKAQERINAGLALNPDIGFSQDIKKYLDEQIKRFPKRNTLLLLENL